jgi:hypothetical protein
MGSPKIIHGKLPTAREAKDSQEYVVIGKYAVSRNCNDQQQNMRFLWRVHGPMQKDGTREILDDFATYREAVKDARAREAKDIEESRSAHWRLSGAAPEMAKAIDEALSDMLPIYCNGPASGMSMEEWSVVLWTLIRAVCKARGKRVPKELPETWCETCGSTGRVVTEPGSYDQGRVECPDCRTE